MIEENDGSAVYYIREPNGALIARVVGSTLDATTTRYYHFDALGSTRKLTDDDGDVTDTYAYDAWGNTTHTGDTEQPYQYVGQLGYYTHYQDDNLDLLQLGVRFYDPETGRFTQRDPLGLTAGLNMYVYSHDLPAYFTDPTGRYGGPNAVIRCPEPCDVPKVDYIGCMMVCMSTTVTAFLSPCRLCLFLPPGANTICALSCMAAAVIVDGYLCHRLCSSDPCASFAEAQKPIVPGPIPGLPGGPPSVTTPPVPQPPVTRVPVFMRR